MAEALSKLRSDAEFLGESCDAVSIVEKLQSFKMRKVAFCVVGDGYDEETVYLLEKPNVVAGSAFAFVRRRRHENSGRNFTRFEAALQVRLLRLLRRSARFTRENGCPWDKEQTHKSIVKKRNRGGRMNLLTRWKTTTFQILSRNWAIY